MIKPRFIALTLFFAVLSVASGCGKTETSSKSGPTKVSGQPTTTASGLQYWDIVVGSGATAAPGGQVSVHYTGWLPTGEKFDSSVDRGQPFSFPLGAGQVIKGWDEGVAGMKVGGKRQLRIPPDLGYGARGAGGVIPPNATLIFDVELLDVSK
jgi:FKBP-type peptidyl-prolyl cis-trans isomerase